MNHTPSFFNVSGDTSTLGIQPVVLGPYCAVQRTGTCHQGMLHESLHRWCQTLSLPSASTHE